MLNAALFVGDTIHARELTLADGSVELLHFREIPSPDLRMLQTAAGTDKELDAATSRVIAASLCEPDGKPAVTVEQAGKLIHGIRMAIITAVAEVNGIGARVGKVSPPAEMNGSGTPSS